MPTDLLEHRTRGIDDAVKHLMIEFKGSLSIDCVRRVVTNGRRDLVSEVPAEALPEFLHRLARQRLVELRTEPTDRDSRLPRLPNSVGAEVPLAPVSRPTEEWPSCRSN